jgi:hypothetical protein
MARPKIPDGLRRRNLLDLVVVALVIGTSELLGLIPEEHGLLGPLSHLTYFINADPEQVGVALLCFSQPFGSHRRR